MTTSTKSAGHENSTGGSNRNGTSKVPPIEERLARCIALETAYVRDVYEEHDLQTKSRTWPKVEQFLEELEPGSLVCDVGCGSGKYFSINQSIFKIGVDRCSRLADLAREKDNEVLICDNLSLPFRDESFDAVLSVAVIHHFATTERRVGALKELARLLRIGGKLIISVWAMEQRHRKFESQDVLVTWKNPQNVSSTSLEFTSTTNTTSDEDNMLPPYHAYTQTSDSDSNRSIRNVINSFRKRTRHKGRSIDPTYSSSPSSSSLSSPNETCYSFVRRTFLKLAGRRRNRRRPWFLDSWNYGTKPTVNPNWEDNEDIYDIPIELRHIEEDDLLPKVDLYKTGQKSKSLGDIRIVKQDSLIRSASNTTTLKVMETKPEEQRVRPKLVKQKQSLNDEDDLDAQQNQRDVVEALPDFRLMHSHYNKRGNVFKQSSMNEELLSTERLREKERVKKNIQKQASLNEDLIYRRYRTLDSLRDSLFSVSNQFQLLKNGLTNLKTETSGFVRMLQGWKEEVPKAETKTTTIEEVVETNERRHSKEDGSDSSKDSSLQSDTSVDSEDSFASVIFVPKQDSQEITSPLSPAPTSPRLKSGPTSPRLKSNPTSPRLKQISVYPLLTTKPPKILIYSQSTPYKPPPPPPPPPPVVEEPPVPIPPPPPPVSTKLPDISEETTPVASPELYRTLAEKYKLQKIPAFSSDKTRTDRLRQIRDLLSQKPDFGKRITRGNGFPILRRGSAQIVGKKEMIAKSLPRLLSLELFNPETDDMDSDSSGVSSPDSVDSVISVEVPSDQATKVSKDPSPLENPVNATISPNDGLSSMSLLEAAANVATTLDNAVDTAIQSSKELDPMILQSKVIEMETDFKANYNNKDNNKTDDYETRFPFDNIQVIDDPSQHGTTYDLAEHLADFANKISEDVLKEINDYEEKIQEKEILEKFNDPYIHKLSEEIKDLTKLSAELTKERKLYLDKLNSDQEPLIKQTNSTDSLSSAQLLSSGDLSERSSDWSRGDAQTTGSTASLSSCKDWAKSKRLTGRRSTSEDIPEVKRAPLIRQHASFQEPSSNTRGDSLNVSSSLNNTSQESLASDSAGGSISIHRYYHVFREGELDQLIERYVENLHIITSYYDHASWCIVAEKVRVWTI